MKKILLLFVCFLPTLVYALDMPEINSQSAIVYDIDADTVILDKNSDEVADGSATVGWPNRYHAMNAMRLNDGTVHIKADHFVDITREESNDAVVEAQAKALGFKKGG